MAANEYLPLFTFGTLRRGQENHRILAGTFDLWLPGTLRDYKRAQAAHGFPAVIPSPGESVSGELFFIRREAFDRTLLSCDILEDIPEGELTGRYYRRARVTIETDEGPFTAWAYLDPRS